MSMPFDLARIVRPPGTIGADLRYHEDIDSTNREFARLAPGSWGHGTVIVADHQHAGRGRRGAAWMAPPGTALLLSVALAWPATVALTYATMLAALAVRDAIADACDLRPDIKWPNDVLLAGRKVCGILAETLDRHGESFVLLGIGINVNQDEAALRGAGPDAGSLAWAAGHAVDREKLAERLFECLELWYRVLTERPEEVFTVWSRSLVGLGGPVTVAEAGGSWQGTAVGVDPDGGLVVRKDDGETKTVYAAYVSIRAAGRTTGRSFTA